MSDKNSELKAVSKVLGEPIFGELSENILKILRNLLVISLVSIFVIYGDLRIDPNSTIFGLKFRGLTENIIVYGLSIANTYLFLHYLWCCFDSFAEWRVRVTGTRLTYITTARLAGNHQDYPNDPRQSTLYYWWKEQAASIGNITGTIEEIDQKLSSW